MHLQEPALFLELIENVAGVGSWWADLTTGTLNWSKQVYIIHGVTPQEYTPDLESGINFYHPDDRHLVEEYVNAAIQRKEPFDFELRLLRRDGSIRWVHSKGECRLNDDGTVVAIYGIFQDMTNRRETEEKLRISEERYQLAVKGSSDGVWDWNIHTNALYWSPRFMEIVGIKSTTFVPELSDFEDRLHEDDHDWIMQALKDHLNHGTEYNVEYRLRREDGSYVWVHASGQATWDENGNPVRMAGSFTDIQERKEIEQRLRLAVAATNSGIWDWVDVNADEEWWSPRFYELLGYEKDEIEPSLTNFADFLHPDDKERTFSLVSDVFAKKSEFDIEYRLKTKEGAYRWFQGYGKVEFDKDDNPQRMVGSITDIQGKKEVEATLLWQLKALENSINGIALLDASGNYAYMNQAHAELYGYETPEELYGKTWKVLYAPPEIELIETKYFPALLQQGYWQGDTLGKKKDGTPIFTSIGLTALEDGGSICVAQDVTERMRMSQSLEAYALDLERSNQELDDFAYIASHDLKAPLRAIDNLASWIIEDSSDKLPEESKTHLEQLKHRVLRMEDLLNDLLAYSRVGRTKSNAEEIYPTQMINEILEMLNPPKGFVFDIAQNMPMVVSEPSPIKQIFLNLLGNAVKHHDREQGHISVTASETATHIEFRVTDDGPGISPAYHKKIFELFQTLKPRDEIEGSGMGLAIIKKLVIHHKGKINVESNGQRGTTFIFTWPQTP